MQLWEQAAKSGQIYAHVELAKVYEHKFRDFAEAARWTKNAIEQLRIQKASAIEQNRWLAELEHRLNRLHRKIERKKS